MSDDFAISTRPACHIIVRGDVDAATAPQLEAAIPLTGSVWLDCSGVTFLDSSGLGVIVTAHTAAKHRGDRLHVSGLNAGPRRVVQMTQIWDVLCAE
jgi:anti-sigma B factor antagonist